MEVVVTTGAVRCAKLQANRHHQQTNTHCTTVRKSLMHLKWKIYATAEQMRQFQVTSELTVPNSSVANIFRQRISDCWTGRSEGTLTKSALTNTWYSQSIDNSRSHMMATSNVGDWYAIISKVCCGWAPPTKANGHSKLVLHLPGYI